MKRLIIAAALATVASPVSAAVITFNALPGNNGDVFASPYTEAGFTVTPVVNQTLYIAKAYGNPTPDLYFSGTGQSFDITGGLFTLQSFQAGLGAAVGNSTYIVTGFLNNVQTFTQTLVNTNMAFNTQTVNSGVLAFNRVRFTLSTTSTSANIDNITLNATGGVPEPATWAMMLLGFGTMAYALRRQPKVRTRISFV